MLSLNFTDSLWTEHYDDHFADKETRVQRLDNLPK